MNETQHNLNKLDYNLAGDRFLVPLAIIMRRTLGVEVTIQPGGEW